METTQHTLGKAKTFIALYGAFSTVVLLTVVVRSIAGHPASSFMWGRTCGVLASAAVTYWLAVTAAKGARWAFVRVRIISVVVPIAIVAIDLIPGALPAWFIAMQIVCAIAFAPTAFIVNAKQR